MLGNATRAYDRYRISLYDALVRVLKASDRPSKAGLFDDRYIPTSSAKAD